MNRKNTGKRMKNEGKAKQPEHAAEAAAFAHLKRVHPELYAAALPHRGSIASRVAPKHTNAALFERLTSSIVSQQLSTKAAASIFARLKAALGGKVTPETLLHANTHHLRAAGLSASKVRSLQELSSAVIDKQINLLALKKAPPEEALSKLTAIYGIGPWTAEMFLIFAVGSPDIFSPGDLILARRVQKLYSLPTNVSKKEMAKLAELWSPHRSFVSLLFWKLHHAENG